MQAHTDDQSHVLCMLDEQFRRQLYFQALLQFLRLYSEVNQDQLLLFNGK